MTRKQEIVRHLEENNMQALREQGARDPGIFRTLISLAYDRQQVVSWRAIEAVGVIAGEVAKSNPEKVRHLAQRLLWMLREESGNNPWSAPDMLGEMVRNSPDQLADIAPIIPSFHDEAILHRGVLRAMVRIAEVRPDLVADQGHIAYEYLNHNDPVTRAYAVQLIGILRQPRMREALEPLAGDGAEAVLYVDGSFRTYRVGELASDILNKEKKGR